MSTVADLVALHAQPRPVDEVHSILNYAEVPRRGDWTLRSALVRLAQPHPLRSEAVLQLVRRLDAALKPMVRSLQKHGVTTTRSIPGGLSNVDDIRLVDIVASDELLAEYDASVGLTDDERASVGLVRLAMTLDGLSTTLAEWANAGSEEPPISEIDSTCAAVLAAMNDQGVPVEQEWTGPRGGRGARGV